MSFDPDQIIDRRRLKRRITVWRTAAIVVIVLLLFLLIQQVFGTLIHGNHVAWLDVRGLIVENRDRQKSLDNLTSNDRARALIVYIDSPGGTTYGGEDLYRTLRKVADHKPVIAVIGTLGTSAGYLVALASERIYARPTSITGSIGVLMETAEISKLLDRIGVSTDTIKSSEFKSTPSPLQPMTQTGRAVVQAVIDDSHNWFIEILAERRNLKVDRARTLGDGRVYTGRQALDVGLIDELGAVADARRWLETQHKIPRELPFRNAFAPQLRRGLLGQIFDVAQKMVFSERLTLDGLISVWQPDY